MRTGWVCPKCQKVYSPDQCECWACNQSALSPAFRFQPSPAAPSISPPNAYPPWVITCGSVSVTADPNIMTWN